MPPKIVRCEIQGMEAFLSECKKVESGGKKTLSQLLLEAATMTHKIAVKSIQTGARSGKTYFKTGARVAHVAAAAGEPPKNDTGVLVQNLTLEKDSGGYTVGSRKGAPHGFWQEFGTSKMPAHPWLAPAFDKMTEMFLRKYK